MLSREERVRIHLRSGLQRGSGGQGDDPAAVENGYSVVAVDDCSTDATWEKLRGLGVPAIRHPVILGQGASLQTAMQYALSQGAQHLVHFDADGQHVPDQIPRLLAELESGRADVVLGSRFLMPTDCAEVPPARRVVLQLARWVNFLMCGQLLSDAYNGFRALSRTAAMTFDIRDNRFGHAPEILSQARRHGLRIVEVPVTIRYTPYARHKGQRLMNAPNIILDLLAQRLFK